VCVLVFLVGCVTAQVKSANSALEAARAAGKDKECPADFQAAENMVRQAEGLCKVCKPEEANAVARDAEAKIAGLCPAVAKPAAPAPAPAPAPEAVRVPAPTASLTASPEKVEAGGCSTLSWTTTNATSVTIEPGIGTVDASGSRTVCPPSTMRYTLTATGTGGTGSGSATVEVAAKAAPAARLTIHVNFDTDKSVIRKADVAELQKAEEFVKKYPTCKIEVGGHTDSRGSEEYNQGLSERRANAVKKWLIDHGASSEDHIDAKGYGESNPVGDNATEKGRFENRRAEILIFCQ
jgi:outer membrane protein OmpA-like peptidoglycan-associated protein